MTTPSAPAEKIRLLAAGETTSAWSMWASDACVKVATSLNDLCFGRFQLRHLHRACPYAANERPREATNYSLLLRCGEHRNISGYILISSQISSPGKNSKTLGKLRENYWVKNEKKNLFCTRTPLVHGSSPGGTAPPPRPGAPGPGRGHRPR